MYNQLVILQLQQKMMVKLGCLRGRSFRQARHNKYGVTPERRHAPERKGAAYQMHLAPASL
ncbi:hypothetical protein ACR9GP_21350 [Enterobacter ludwigii]